MFTLDELASNERIRMERDKSLRERIQTLFRQTYDECKTIRAVFMHELKYELTEDEAETIRPWFIANLRKCNKRKTISVDDKQELCKKQNWKCAVCGETIGQSLVDIHVDHIIPFVLVGDELKDNYQALCATCNLCKSAHTDYIFRSLLKII